MCLRMLNDPALQVADRSDTDLGPLGQGLLRQPCIRSVLPKEKPEGRWLK
jgi:hypothetical protein